MMIYVVLVVEGSGVGKVSQEGYTSLEKAQAFIEGRADNPKKINNYTYRADNYIYYRICEVAIK